MTNIDKKGIIINDKVLIATVDVGRKYNYGYWTSPNGEECKPFRFKNNRGGFERFWTIISKAMVKFKLNRVVIGSESTGPYGEPLQHFLKEKAEVDLVQVNPMHTKRVKELEGNSPQKSDEKDPRVIAMIIKLGHYLSCIIPEGAAAELRSLNHAREFQMEKLGGLSNRLDALLFRVFPEFREIIKGPLCQTGRYLLSNYTTPKQIVSLGLEELSRIMKQKSRGVFGISKAKEFFEAAMGSVGIKEGLSGLVLEIKLLLKEIEQCEEAIGQIELELGKWLKEIPYSEHLLSIKGIGIVTVAGIIGEVGDFRTYSSQGAIIKIAGLNLYEISSGIHRGERHISKRGRPLMRKILYFAALNVVKPGGIMHQEYKRKVDRGQKKIKALVAIATKLLSVMYAMVRDDTDHISNYSELDKAA